MSFTGCSAELKENTEIMSMPFCESIVSLSSQTWLLCSVAMGIAWYFSYRLIPRLLKEYADQLSVTLVNRVAESHIGFSVVAIAVLCSLLFFSGDAYRRSLLIGLAPVLAGMCWVDFKLQLIPDRFQILGALVALSSRFLDFCITQKLLLFEVLAALLLVLLIQAMAVLYRYIRGLDGLGFADIKLLAWMCLCVGLDIWKVVIIACFLALVINLVRRFIHRLGWQDEFAFGPFLVIAFTIQLAL